MATKKTAKLRLKKARPDFRFRWWMGLLLVVVVTIVGVAIIRLSQASGGVRVTSTYTTWQFNAPPQGFNTMEYNSAILSAPASGQGYFWAMQFNIDTNGNDNGGYIGLQSRTDVGGKIQPGAIFSIWNARDGRTEDPNGRAARFGNEGSGFQTMIPYNWQVNRPYKVIVQRVYDGRPGYIGSVKDLLSGQESYIGRIYAPSGDWRGLVSQVGSFTEHYYGAIYSCSQLTPPVAARFGHPVFNGNTMVAQHVNSLQPNHDCASSDRFVDTGLAVEHIVGYGNYNTTTPPSVNLSGLQALAQSLRSPIPGNTQRVDIGLPSYGRFSEGDPKITQPGASESAQCEGAEPFKGTLKRGCKLTAATPLTIISNTFVPNATSRQKIICIITNQPTNLNVEVFNIFGGSIGSKTAMPAAGARNTSCTPAGGLSINSFRTMRISTQTPTTLYSIYVAPVN